MKRFCRTGRLVILAAATLGVLLSGVSPAMAAKEDRLREMLRSRGVDPEGVVFPAVLTEEMREWLYHKVPRVITDTAKMETLILKLLSPNELNLEYDAEYTGTAAEVFEKRRANCLAFTHLVVGMARELGVEAYYMKVDRVERYRREGDLVVASGHITAGFGEGLHRRVVEFRLGPQIDYRSARPISDLAVLAMYYTNRGAEMVLANDLESADEMLNIATRIDPTYADAWVNLGVVRRRLEDHDGAEMAYRAAADIDPQNVSAYQNLSALYRIQGKRDPADEILKLLDRRGNRNPYIFLELGDASITGGQIDEARRYFKRARRLAGGRAETNAAMGEWAILADDLEQARKWLQRAESIDATDVRTVRLRRQIESSQTQ